MKSSCRGVVSKRLLEYKYIKTFYQPSSKKCDQYSSPKIGFSILDIQGCYSNSGIVYLSRGSLFRQMLMKSFP